MRESNPELHRQRVSKSLIGKFGEQSRRWKGNNAGYVAKHLWIIKHFGKADHCEMNRNHQAKRYEWANIDGKYSRKREDYIQLCPSCHRVFDKLNFCKWGHPYTPENTYQRSSRIRHRECKVCRREAQRRYKNAKTNKV